MPAPAADDSQTQGQIPDKRRSSLLERVRARQRNLAEQAGVGSGSASSSSSSEMSSPGATNSTAFVPDPSQCYLQVKVLNDTSTGGHKFKVIGIIVGAYAGSKERMKLVANSLMDDRFVHG